MRLGGDVKAIRSDNGSEMREDFGLIHDRHETLREYIPPDVSEVNGVIEYAISTLTVTQQAAKEQAHARFPDASVPQGMDLLWGKSMA